MTDENKPKKEELEINDLTGSSLTDEETKSVSGGFYAGSGIRIVGSLTLGATASSPPVSNGHDFSTNIGGADEDVD